MKVLLIHPQDDLLDGPWAASPWDRVIDLGRSGVDFYTSAESRFGCAVTPLNSFRAEFKEIRKVRDLFSLGMGRLLDEYGLDWWELTSILFHHKLDVLVPFSKMAKTLDPSDEVYLSRPGFYASAFETLLQSTPRVFPAVRGRGAKDARHYARVFAKFPAQQLIEIFWDKFDAGYQLRGRFASKPKRQRSPVVLLPTAYVNVSRTGIEYAKTLSDTQFMLVATRPSGWIKSRPPNVSMAWLRSYASVGEGRRATECADLLTRWQSLRTELERVQEFRILAHIGGFEDFAQRITRGLEIRDAWRNVLDSEPVQALICADDANPYTLIPLLLVRERGIPVIACHHGALDGAYIFKRPHADVILAKGAMEEDYLLRVCGLPHDKVEIGAPSQSNVVSVQTNHGSHIVFFSESYEVGGGRAKDFYRDVLPRLANLAISEGRELVVKLHPAESASERHQMIRQLLRPEQLQITRLVTGRLQEDLFQRTWFAVTVLSTITTECAVRGIPCFLCKWLESWPYGYIEQFDKFGVGIRLDRPEEISDIPQRLSRNVSGPEIQKNCWQPIAPARLKHLLDIGGEDELVRQSMDGAKINTATPDLRPKT